MRTVVLADRGAGGFRWPAWCAALAILLLVAMPTSAWSQRQFETVLFLHLLAIIENQVNRLGNFRDGFESVLANLQRQYGGEFKLSLGHQLGGAAKCLNAFGPGSIVPRGKSGSGCVDRLPNVGAFAALKTAEHLAGIGRIQIGEGTGLT